jgi:hypothetical protein
MRANLVDILGGVLLLGALAVAIFRANVANVTVLAGAGVVLLLVGSPTIQKMAFGPSGMSFERIGPPAPTQQEGLRKAEAVPPLPQPAPPSPPSTPSSPPATTPSAQQVAKSTVLVFYRDGQAAAANSTAEALRKSGYTSSATNTNLSEVVKQVTPDTDTQAGAILIAVAGNNTALANDVKKVVTRAAPAARLTVDFEWGFKASEAQVYLF